MEYKEGQLFLGQTVRSSQFLSLYLWVWAIKLKITVSIHCIVIKNIFLRSTRGKVPSTRSAERTGNMRFLKTKNGGLGSPFK